MNVDIQVAEDDSGATPTVNGTVNAASDKNLSKKLQQVLHEIDDDAGVEEVKQVPQFLGNMPQILTPAASATVLGIQQLSASNINSHRQADVAQPNLSQSNIALSKEMKAANKHHFNESPPPMQLHAERHDQRNMEHQDQEGIDNNEKRVARVREADEEETKELDPIVNPFAQRSFHHHQSHQRQMSSQANNNNSIFHQRGQPRFSSGSEGEEEDGGVNNNIVSHRTGGQGSVDTLEVEEAKYDPAVLTKIRGSPGIRGSLPRMSVDGDTNEKRLKQLRKLQENDNIEDEEADFANVPFKASYLKNERLSGGEGGNSESKGVPQWQKTLMQQSAGNRNQVFGNSKSPQNSSQKFKTSHHVNVRKPMVQKKKSMFRTRGGGGASGQIINQTLQGGSDNLITLDFYQNNNSLNQEQLQYIETDRGVELERVTPTGIRDNHILLKTSRGSGGEEHSVHRHGEGFMREEHEDSQGQQNNENNPLYESRDFGVKVLIDTLSNQHKQQLQQHEDIAHPVPPFQLDDSKGAGAASQEEIQRLERLGEDDVGEDEKAQQIMKEDRELDQDLLDNQEPFIEQEMSPPADMRFDVNPFSTQKFQETAEGFKTTEFYHITTSQGEAQAAIITEEEELLKNKVIEEPSPVMKHKKKNRWPDELKSKDQLKSSKYSKKLKDIQLAKNRLSVIALEQHQQDESNLTDKFAIDFQARPMMDDQKAKKMILNELQAKRIQEEMKKDSSFFLVVDKTPLERADDIQGRCRFVKVFYRKVSIYLSSWAVWIITSKPFEVISIIVIMANSVSLAIEDPKSTEESEGQAILDNVFLALYTVEMVLKISGMGFIIAQQSYLRDSWNLLDFVVVVSGYLQLMFQGTSINLSGLRVLRVLRPLRSIQKIEGLKRIVQALLASLPLLGDTLIVLFFFFFIFAIAGLQLFGGSLKQRCINEDTGENHPDDQFCGYADCPPSYYCGKTLKSMNFDQTNFDTIFYSLIAIFTSVTLEGWTSVMAATWKAYTPLSFLFFIPLVFIGAFFLLNLTLAVIKAKFSDEHQKKSDLNSAQIAAKSTSRRLKKKLEELNFDDLDDDEKKQLIKEQMDVRNVVLKKWKTIMFIKERMRENMRKFRAKKELKLRIAIEKQQAATRPQSPQKVSLEVLQQERPVERRGQRDQSQRTPAKPAIQFTQEAQVVQEVPDEMEDQEGIEIENNFAQAIKRARQRREESREDVAEQIGENEKLEKEFFQDFIQNDINAIDKRFSYQEIKDMAKTLEQGLNLSPEDCKKLISATPMGNSKPFFQEEQNQKDDDEIEYEAAINDNRQSIQTPKRIGGSTSSKIRVKPLQLELLNSVNSPQKKFESPAPKPASMKHHLESTNDIRGIGNFTFNQKSEVKNKIVPFAGDDQMNDNVELLPQKLPFSMPPTAPQQEIMTFEKSVLNSRFMVEQEIKPTQKIYVRRDKMTYHSEKDVFENRKASPVKKESENDLIPVGFQQLNLNAKDVLLKSFFNTGIRPYQRRLLLTPKVFVADDEQSECLAILEMEPNELELTIQKKYDENYISEFYVTSTVSVCVNPKGKESWIQKRQRIRNQELGNGQKNQVISNFQKAFTLQRVIMKKDTLETPTPFREISIKPLEKKGFQSTLKRGTSDYFLNNTISFKSAAVDRMMQDHETFKKHIHQHLFFRNTTEPQLSQKLAIKQSLTEVLERRKHIMQGNNAAFDSNREQQEEEEKALLRRQVQLNKKAARDAQLQRKLIITQINKGAFRSRLYRHLLVHRRNNLTDEEKANPRIFEMYDMYQEEELAKINNGGGNAEGDDEFSSSDDDDDEEARLRDDFLDMPTDYLAEVRLSKENTRYESKTITQWSGQEVLIDYDPEHAQNACHAMSKVRVWPMKARGIVKRVKIWIKTVVQSMLFDNFLTFCVFLNTLCLALDRYGMPEDNQWFLTLFNMIFTWIFILEMSMKVFGLGPVKYLKDRMNHLDGIVVVVSIAEMLIVSDPFSGAHQAFRSVRIFRIFRVIRIARLLRTFQSMQTIIHVLVKSMNSFIYLALLLLLFLFIFTLLGMQLFGGHYNYAENFDGSVGVPINNFDTFNSAFLTTFQLLTMESWPQLMYDGLRSDVPRVISALYFVSWVFLGNFMLLNLFLAILLDSFTDESVIQKNEEELDPELERQQHFQMVKSLTSTKLILYHQQAAQSSTSAKSTAPKGLGLTKKKKPSGKKKEHLLDESFEYEQEQLTRKMSLVHKPKVEYDNVFCEKSFFLLSKQNWLRRNLYKTVINTKFEGVVLVLIIFSSLKLVLDTYISDLPSDSEIVILSDNLDNFFTAAFGLESFIKSIAYGLVLEQGTYLRETWNQLDFLIVTVSVIDASFENINMPFIKILRLLRVLRPLRFISHNSGMKTIVVALVQSVGGIFNVAIVVMIVWMMFAILAVNLFGGKLHYCSVDQYVNHTETLCRRARGRWLNHGFNYDSVPQAMLTLFSLATLENWPTYMYTAVDIQGEELGPKAGASPEYAYFFVVFVLIGSFLFLNLFVGVIFKEFEDAQEEERASLMLKDHQMKWVDMMKMIVKATPDLETTNRPKKGCRKKMHTFVTGGEGGVNYFDSFIMVCIVLNMLHMSLDYDDSSLKYNQTLNSINYFFTCVFVLEFILKFIAFGLSYFETNWNRFDFCVVLSSLFEIVLDSLSVSQLKFIRTGPQLAKILRVTRVSRLLRLVNRYKGLQALLQTIYFSLPSIMNVFALLMLIYFIFAVLGTFLFKRITEGEIINEQFNFSNFGMSMLIVIRMSTGEDWNMIMQDTMRGPEDGCIPGKTCGLSYAPIFFIPLQMLCTFIMLNLFILVIIQQFQTYYLDTDNVISKFKDDLERFKQTWTNFTKDHNCIKIKDTRLVAFMGQMDAPLGMRGEKMNDIIKSVMQMELVSDNEGFVYFNELLYKSMRRVYGDPHVKNRILVEQEIITMKRIQEIKEKMIKRSRVQERLKAAQVNPFTLQLFMNASFKAWLKIHRQNAAKREEERKDKATPGQGSKGEDEGKGRLKKGLQKQPSGFSSDYHSSDDDSKNLNEGESAMEYKTIEDVELDSDFSDSMQESYFEPDEALGREGKREIVKSSTSSQDDNNFNFHRIHPQKVAMDSSRPLNEEENQLDNFENEEGRADPENSPEDFLKQQQVPASGGSSLRAVVLKPIKLVSERRSDSPAADSIITTRKEGLPPHTHISKSDLQ